MRRFLCGLAALGLLAAQQAAAQQQCPVPADQSMFEVEALKSALMVLATGCHDDAEYNAKYNAFVNRYQPSLAANAKAFDGYFKHRYGKQGQREHDAYITALANAVSDTGMRLGTDFCPRNGAMFNEVMALRGPADLPSYAAAKDLVPPSLGACAVAPPVKTVATRSRQAKRATHK
jgi:hypothetical protein